MPTARMQQKKETRERLISSAVRLCLRRGFAATRTVDIARQARVSHGALFVHFPTREALIREVVEVLGRKITERVHEAASRSGSLRDVLRAHLSCLAENEASYRRLLMEGPLLPASAREVWIGIQSAIAFHISQAAEREMAEGRIRRVPLHLLFNTWVGLIHHYLMNADLFAPGRSVLAEHGEALVKHTMGLLARK